jgi:hypothetical protein
MSAMAGSAGVILGRGNSEVSAMKTILEAYLIYLRHG